MSAAACLNMSRHDWLGAAIGLGGPEMTASEGSPENSVEGIEPYLADAFAAGRRLMPLLRPLP